MMRVRLGKLKAQLSHYLRAVRRGETVTIPDRDTPVAPIVPVRQPALQVRKAVLGSVPLHRVPLPPRLDLDIDIVQFLLEDRQKR
jgi:prevent-host-death family protein